MIATVNQLQAKDIFSYQKHNFFLLKSNSYLLEIFSMILEMHRLVLSYIFHISSKLKNTKTHPAITCPCQGYSQINLSLVL